MVQKKIVWKKEKYKEKNRKNIKNEKLKNRRKYVCERDNNGAWRGRERQRESKCCKMFIITESR